VAPATQRPIKSNLGFVELEEKSLAKGILHRGQRLAQPFGNSRLIIMLAEIAGLCILPAAGTNVLPHNLQIVNYKAWMPTVPVLWWIVLALGIATSIRWYVPL